MTTTKEGLLFALASMVTLGISSYLYKRSTDAIGPTNTTFFYYLFGLIIASVIWFFFREKQVSLSLNLLWPGVLALFLFSSVWTFNYAVNLIDVSVATTIRSLGFVVTIMLAITLSSESLTPREWFAVAFATIAVILFGSAET
ncbi:MAG TPA: DMT family transporter [Leptolyngbyaceae cyanobacterium M65_K2018_010]|nr:DMT family transporter [Leptolyngbyaceae cyanobacterium M65_K2018_010]